MLRPLSENDTHCLQFSYFLYSRDGHSPGGLGVYVRVNGGSRGNAVWNVSGSQGRQWQQVEIAVSTFWPSEYQVRHMNTRYVLKAKYTNFYCIRLICMDYQISSRHMTVLIRTGLIYLAFC